MCAKSCRSFLVNEGCGSRASNTCSLVLCENMRKMRDSKKKDCSYVYIKFIVKKTKAKWYRTRKIGAGFARTQTKEATILLKDILYKHIQIFATPATVAKEKVEWAPGENNNISRSNITYIYEAAVKIEIREIAQNLLYCCFCICCFFRSCSAFLMRFKAYQFICATVDVVVFVLVVIAVAAVCVGFLVEATFYCCIYR